MVLNPSKLRTHLIVGLIVLVKLGSLPAFADEAGASGTVGFFDSIRGALSSFFQSFTSQRTSAEVVRNSDGEPGAQPSPQMTAQPAQSSQTSTASIVSQTDVSPQLVPSPVTTIVEKPAQRPFVSFARRAGYPAAIFRPHERFDVTDPESFARLSDALADDEQANELVTFVLNETGKSSLSELITFKAPSFALENGWSSVTTDDKNPKAVLKGWPGVDENGALFVDPNPGDRLTVTVELNPRGEMIEIYSTIIHELTHVRGHLLRMKKESLDDVLNYQSVDEYALWRIEGQGGELEAFTAETSAVIRYRNRYHLPYESFHTPIYDRFFDFETGEIKDREGFESKLSSMGGTEGQGYYLISCGSEFKTLVKSELDYVDSLVQQLKSHPSYESNRNVREEARRLELRAQRIRTQLASALP